ncbi:ribonuclease Y [Streptacidiphilus monticola]|uniref:Ribonuclease Y n=1 Tax=Streptacidiphilus monticola TaxID=2161674 RepID=A0ABW1G2S6_9ACTN
MDVGIGTVVVVSGLLLVVSGLSAWVAHRSSRARLAELERREARNAEREARLDAEQERLHLRQLEAAEAQAELARSREELRSARELADTERRAALERVAGLTVAEARSQLQREIEQQAKRDAVLTVREIERRARSEGEQRAREIVASAVQRVAVEQTTDSVTTSLSLAGEELKGRIIGREGRNIRSFEQVTGVNLIVDDTPGQVLLSCFDPVRREVARLSLTELLADGRIHPLRIEEVVERTQEKVEQLCLRAAEEAVAEAGLDEMHPELLRLLGRLKYRTSYGQNVLGHLLESAHIAGMMAAELRIDPQLVRRATLLHDIGKAVTHEVEGSHARIGADLARRYGESEDVVHAVAAHHGEIEPRTVEAVLTQAADACSGGRPGARRESAEVYARRMEGLERIARRYEGVHKVYAMQAGREVRVMVLPEVVDDLQAQVIAHDIAKRVEDELTYPGRIRITVIRESRATEYAR